MQPAPDAHGSHGREARSLRRRDVAPDRAIVLRDPGSGIREPRTRVRYSECKSERELHDPGVTRQAGDGADRGCVRHVPVRQTEVGRVEQIEYVPPQRPRVAAAELNQPLQGHIVALVAWTSQAISELVAEHA